MLDLAVAVPTLLGSYLSMLAAGSVFICYIILPAQKHYRHTLIMNLAGADFFNALNNSISGTYVLIHRGIPAGSACTINGWVGQLTVQATDFTILFMTIATVITLRKHNYKPKTDRLTKLLITCCIWFVPLVTSSTGLYMDAYKPATGNWCWIGPTPTILRYALGHIWRLTIIFTTIGLYIYLFIYIHQHFASLRAASDAKIPTITSDKMSESSDETGFGGIVIHSEFEIVDESFDAWWENQIPSSELEFFDLAAPRNELSEEAASSSPPSSPIGMIKQNFRSSYTPPPRAARTDESAPLLYKTRDPLAIVRRPTPPPNKTTTIQVGPPPTEALWSQEYFIQKMLLLNAYPIAYVLLWVPGIANRFAELMGYKMRGLAIAQASTQFVGLANALVYGYNERIWSLTKLWWKTKREKVNIDTDKQDFGRRGSESDVSTYKSSIYKSSTYKSPFRKSTVPYISNPIPK